MQTKKMTRPKKTALIQLRRHLLAGVAVTLPIVLSMYVAYWLFINATNFAMKMMPQDIKEFYGMQIIVRALSLMFMVTIIAFIGMLASNIIGRRLFTLGDNIMKRIPLFNKIYILLKQLSDSVLEADRTKSFKGVCLVEFPKPEHYMLGFITTSATSAFHNAIGSKTMCVFCPTSPNPTSGFLLFVPEHDIVRLDTSVEEAFRMILSGGVVQPERPPAAKRKDTEENHEQ